jgi:glycosyltransferase involved in cell wall biosynthesis
MTPGSIAILTLGLTGGAFGNLAAALAKGFRAAGIRKLYLLHISRDRGRPPGLDPSVAVVPLGSGRSLWTPIALSRTLRRLAPDVLISMPTFVNLAAVMGRLLAARCPTRLIVSEHAMKSYKVFTEHRAEMKFRALPSLVRLLYPRADALVAVSPEVLEDLLATSRVRLDPSRTRVIPNPMDAERIGRLAEEPADHPWLKAKRTPVILSVGRLARQKNYSLLLRAFARIARKTDARLLVAGEGRERGRLQLLAGDLGIRDRVDFPGYTANPYAMMARSDVFALASEEESFGLVLGEAMCCGVPVVATDALGGGPRHILDNGRFGVLVPRNDERVLADSLLRLITSAEARVGLAAAGRLRCRDFSPKKIAEQWISLIETISAVH